MLDFNTGAYSIPWGVKNGANEQRYDYLTIKNGFISPINLNRGWISTDPDWNELTNPKTGKTVFSACLRWHLGPKGRTSNSFPGEEDYSFQLPSGNYLFRHLHYIVWNKIEINRVLVFDSEIKNEPTRPLPPLPHRKKMDDCCKAIARMVKELYDFVEPQKITKSEAPKRLIYPEATGVEKLTSLSDIIAYFIREIDHKGFDTGRPC